MSFCLSVITKNLNDVLRDLCGCTRVVASLMKEDAAGSTNNKIATCGHS
jgi:hypothetical protein